LGALAAPRSLAAPILLVLAYPAARFMGLAIIQLRVILTSAVMDGVRERFAVGAFDHILRLPRAFHLARNTGTLTRVLDRGSAGLESSIRATHVVIFQVLLEALLVCVVLAQVISWRFGLILLVVMAGHAVVAITFTAWQLALRKKRNDRESAASGLAHESLANWDLMRAFGREAGEVGQYAAARRALGRFGVLAQAADSSMNIAWQALQALALTGILALAAADVIAGRMTIAELVLAQVYMLQVFGNMIGLGYVYNEARQGFADLAELQRLLDQPKDAPDPPGAQPLVARAGHVVFDRVSFGYTPGRAAVEEVSLKILPGRTLALVGASGAGKTTLGRLLLRLYDPTAGAIRVDNQDIRTVSRASLAAAIGVVSQDTQLFNETIAYNIRYGRPEASDEEVEAAAREAALHAFIAALPQGYATRVGERGLRLSGGERQRLAIARLFLARPRIFVFDEATSSVDSLTETAIQAGLARVAAGHTTLVIAHRLSMVVDADEIAVIDAGRVVERGDHASLLAAGGRYAELWRTQARLERAASS
jgi:ATP-binding cassette subfamily B protein